MQRGKAELALLFLVREVRGGDSFPKAGERWGQLSSQQTSTWLQALAQTRDVHMAFGGNMGLRHEHRPWQQ